MLHIIIDYERQKHPSNSNKVMPLETLGDDQEEEVSETWLFVVATRLAKICFPLLNLLLISCYFVFGLHGYATNNGSDPIVC